MKHIPTLIYQIVNAHAKSAKIDTTMLIGAIELDINKLQPLGIVIKEEITNSLRYAFQGKANGRICDSESLVNDMVNIDIEDNGIGRDLRYYYRRSFS